MAIIPLRAWYLEKYEPLSELEQRPHDLRLSKSGLLKSGLRADFLDESHQVRESQWFARYLDGDIIEFYIEGSGSYVISNIDLIGHEIYFAKRESMLHLSPVIFWSYQTEFAPAYEALSETLETFIEEFNERSRLNLTLETSQRPVDAPLRLNSRLTSRIRKSLLVIADITPIGSLPGDPPRVMVSPNVCMEVGYALHGKRTEQVLLVNMERSDLSGQLPFDLPKYQRSSFANASDLEKTLPTVLEAMLQRYNLLQS